MQRRGGYVGWVRYTPGWVEGYYPAVVPGRPNIGDSGNKVPKRAYTGSVGRSGHSRPASTGPPHTPPLVSDPLDLGISGSQYLRISVSQD